MSSNRFTDQDGNTLRRYVLENVSTTEALSELRDQAQEREIQAHFKLLQGQLDNVWEQLRLIQDEDFKRPEAEELRRTLTEDIRLLRERYLQLCIEKTGG
jgi:hypothetical protein